MKHLWTILIEFAFLGLLGVLYYYYQKRKIMKQDREDIYASLKEMLADLQEELEKNEIRNKADVTSFIKRLTDSNEQRNYVDLISTLKQFENKIPATFSASFPHFIEQIQFHVR